MTRGASSFRTGDHIAMDIFDRIYAAVDDDAALAELPQHIADLVGTRSATLTHVGADGALRSHHCNYWAPEHLQFYVSGGYHLDDPWVAPASAPGALNRMQTLDAIVPPEAVVNTRFFEAFRSFGDDTALAVGGILTLEDGVLGMAGHAGFGSSGFEARHVAMLQPLVPHVQRLYNLRHRLAGQRPRPSPADGVVDALSCGVLIADAASRILFLNHPAHRILDRRDGLRVTAGVLWAPEKRDRLARAVAIAASRRESSFDALELAGAQGADYRVTVSPWKLEGRSCALVTIDEPGRTPPEALRIAGRLHGLTAAESAILDALMAGLSPEEIAERRTVSLATVRTQVQQLLRKTGTRRITDMLVLIARLPVIAGRRD